MLTHPESDRWTYLRPFDPDCTERAEPHPRFEAVAVDLWNDWTGNPGTVKAFLVGFVKLPVEVVDKLTIAQVFDYMVVNRREYIRLYGREATNEPRTFFVNNKPYGNGDPWQDLTADASKGIAMWKAADLGIRVRR